MRISAPLARRLGAFFTALAGVMNIVSALYPALPQRMEILRDLLPLHLIRSSQTATVLAGFFLILLADGLRKRRRRALQITVAVLIASSLLHLTKGLDFEEASISGALAIGLVLTRHAYDVGGARPVPSRLLTQIATFGLLYYCYVLLGFLLLRHAIHPAPTLSGVSLEPLRLLNDSPLYHYASGQARWFERSIAGLGSAAVLYAVLQLLRPFIPLRRATPSELVRVRALVKRYGADTLSYFAFQHDRHYYFDESGEAFLSYRYWRTVAIVGGHPVGAVDRIPALISSFIEFCDSNGVEPCFLGIGAPDLPIYHGMGLRTLKIGEEALISLPEFDPTSLKRKVRRAARHAPDLGITAVTFRRDRLPDWVARQMHEISRQWMQERGGGERGFSMTLGRLPGPSDSDCEIVAALEGDRLWGYLCLVPAYQGNAWSLDAMRRRPDAPNGLMEYLIIQAASNYRDRGHATLSLNFASLSNSEDNIDSRAVDATRRFLYDHLSSVYQLRSLQQFNDKFAPYWHSRYLAYRDVLKFPKLAIAIAQSEDPIKLPLPGVLFKRS